MAGKILLFGFEKKGPGQIGKYDDPRNQNEYTCPHKVSHHHKRSCCRTNQS
jgi:hypothetical protein